MSNLGADSHQSSEPFDASDSRAVRERVKEAKDKEGILRADLREIMNTEGGRRWVHSALLRCHPYNNPFSSDALRMAFACGEQNVGLQLIGELHACSPELYLQMMKENKDG